jgi:hypothetical protein
MKKAFLLAFSVILSFIFSSGVWAANFVPVTDIINVPTEAIAGAPLNLIGLGWKMIGPQFRQQGVIKPVAVIP